MQAIVRSGIVLVLALGAVALGARGQDPARRIQETAGEALATRQRTQDQLDRWATERADLEARWRTAAGQVAYLEERVRVARERTATVEAAAAELDRRLAEVARLEASLDDSLLAILGRLETAVAADLPFLPQERRDRLAAVRHELGDPAAPAAEKLRRLLEALLIEAGYGGALEVVQDRIAVDGETLTCDLLQVGRLGLFWLTPDGSRGGGWDSARGAFVELEGRALDAVRRAAEVAGRRRPAGVLALPLGRVAP